MISYLLTSLFLSYRLQLTLIFTIIELIEAIFIHGQGPRGSYIFSSVGSWLMEVLRDSKFPFGSGYEFCINKGSCCLSVENTASN